MTIGKVSLANRVTTAITGVMPSGAVENRKVNRTISWIGKRISSPQNRLILGVTALLSQPFIDLNNKKVDEETRKVSAARTVAKIIAGTTTGFTIRYGCIKMIDYCTMLPEQITNSTKFPRLRTLFTPSPDITALLKDLNHHKKALGTHISLAIMIVTNFLIDAPLTKYLTNKFIDKKNINKDFRLAQSDSRAKKKIAVKEGKYA